MVKEAQRSYRVCDMWGPEAAAAQSPVARGRPEAAAAQSPVAIIGAAASVAAPIACPTVRQIVLPGLRTGRSEALTRADVAMPLVTSTIGGCARDQEPGTASRLSPAEIRDGFAGHHGLPQCGP